MEYRECELCKLRPASEIHHIIYRSHCKALIKSEINLIPLCRICHAKIHRGKDSKELNHKLRLQFQNKLEILLDKELHQCLSLRPIHPDDVNLKPELLK